MRCSSRRTALSRCFGRKVREYELIRFLPGRECVSVDQDGEAVHALLKGPEAERVSGDYLVACDGSSSPLRRAMDVKWEGRLLQDMIGVYFTADLTDLVAHRKGILYWIINPAAFGVLIAHWIPHEWVLFTPYFPRSKRPRTSPKRGAKRWLRPQSAANWLI